MTRRLAAEDGFTLVELLVTLIIGLVVVFAAFAVMDGSWRVQAKTLDRVDATDRGRRAMDRIIQQLGARVCLTAGSPTVPAQGSLVTATDSQIEFYASVTSDTAPRLVVERRRMTYRPANRDIRMETWRGTAPPPTPPPATTAPPTSTTILAADVAPLAGIPVFRYYSPQGTPALPTLRRTAPVSSAANRNSVILVKVAFAAIGREPTTGVAFENDALTRSPTCLF